MQGKNFLTICHIVLATIVLYTESKALKDVKQVSTNNEDIEGVDKIPRAHQESFQFYINNLPVSQQSVTALLEQRRRSKFTTEIRSASASKNLYQLLDEYYNNAIAQELRMREIMEELVLRSRQAGNPVAGSAIYTDLPNKRAERPITQMYKTGTNAFHRPNSRRESGALEVLALQQEPYAQQDTDQKTLYSQDSKAGITLITQLNGKPNLTLPTVVSFTPNPEQSIVQAPPRPLHVYETTDDKMYLRQLPDDRNLILPTEPNSEAQVSNIKLKPTPSIPPKKSSADSINQQLSFLQLNAQKLKNFTAIFQRTKQPTEDSKSAHDENNLSLTTHNFPTTETKEIQMQHEALKAVQKIIFSHTNATQRVPTATEYLTNMDIMPIPIVVSERTNISAQPYATKLPIAEPAVAVKESQTLPHQVLRDGDNVKEVLLHADQYTVYRILPTESSANEYNPTKLSIENNPKVQRVNNESLPQKIDVNTTKEALNETTQGRFSNTNNEAKTDFAKREDPKHNEDTLDFTLKDRISNELTESKELVQGQLLSDNKHLNAETLIVRKGDNVPLKPSRIVLTIEVPRVSDNVYDPNTLYMNATQLEYVMKSYNKEEVKSKSSLEQGTKTSAETLSHLTQSNLSNFTDRAEVFATLLPQESKTPIVNTTTLFQETTTQQIALLAESTWENTKDKQDHNTIQPPASELYKAQFNYSLPKSTTVITEATLSLDDISQSNHTQRFDSSLINLLQNIKNLIDETTALPVHTSTVLPEEEITLPESISEHKLYFLRSTESVTNFADTITIMPDTTTHLPQNMLERGFEEFSGVFDEDSLEHLNQESTAYHPTALSLRSKNAQSETSMKYLAENDTKSSVEKTSDMTFFENDDQTMINQEPNELILPIQHRNWIVENYHLNESFPSEDEQMPETASGTTIVSKAQAENLPASISEFNSNSLTLKIYNDELEDSSAALSDLEATIDKSDITKYPSTSRTVFCENETTTAMPTTPSTELLKTFVSTATTEYPESISSFFQEESPLATSKPVFIEGVTVSPETAENTTESAINQPEHDLSHAAPTYSDKGTSLLEDSLLAEGTLLLIGEATIAPEKSFLENKTKESENQSFSNRSQLIPSVYTAIKPIAISVESRATDVPKQQSLITEEKGSTVKNDNESEQFHNSDNEKYTEGDKSESPNDLQPDSEALTTPSHEQIAEGTTTKRSTDYVLEKKLVQSSHGQQYVLVEEDNDNEKQIMEVPPAPNVLSSEERSTIDSLVIKHNANGLQQPYLQESGDQLTIASQQQKLKSEETPPKRNQQEHLEEKDLHSDGLDEENFASKEMTSIQESAVGIQINKEEEIATEKTFAAWEQAWDIAQRSVDKEIYAEDEEELKIVELPKKQTNIEGVTTETPIVQELWYFDLMSANGGNTEYSDEFDNGADSIESFLDAAPENDRQSSDVESVQLDEEEEPDVYSKADDNTAVEETSEEEFYGFDSKIESGVENLWLPQGRHNTPTPASDMSVEREAVTTALAEEDISENKFNRETVMQAPLTTALMTASINATNPITMPKTWHNFIAPTEPKDMHYQSIKMQQNEAIKMNEELKLINTRADDAQHYQHDNLEERVVQAVVDELKVMQGIKSKDNKQQKTPVKARVSATKIYNASAISNRTKNGTASIMPTQKTIIASTVRKNVQPMLDINEKSNGKAHATQTDTSKDVQQTTGYPALVGNESNAANDENDADIIDDAMPLDEADESHNDDSLASAVMNLTLSHDNEQQHDDVAVQIEKGQVVNVNAGNEANNAKQIEKSVQQQAVAIDQETLREGADTANEINDEHSYGNHATQISAIMQPTMTNVRDNNLRRVAQRKDNQFLMKNARAESTQPPTPNAYETDTATQIASDVTIKTNPTTILEDKPTATSTTEIETTNWWHTLPYAEIRKFLNTIFYSVNAINGADDDKA